ncbi:uncharacterized protein LOC107806289 [Nicotiana tabacum]|uniref:Uncharacterized protein LOC107806289 n=2 Tax=Nicotiana TaxID=4085 RepID=A0A1S4BAQ5_TOBAC|nr:PREDICTED: uncharacterized protein LOC104242159 [Nicotiana sylvestris]XP_016485901.1 PREDICTED: uncharacterized protein LOC107806289 [Nicotiana tabacum]
MDPNNNISTTPESSSLSYQPSPNSNNIAPSSSNYNHILEISLISAQDLAPVSKSLRTYALAWINPNKKRSTRIDNEGHNNPTWNDKFSFKVNDEFLYSETSAVHVEIYTVSWFRDVLVGTVHVLLNNLINPFINNSNGKRFVALQIRRPSGNPQGILNMGVSLIHSSMRSMPLICNEIMNPSSLDYRDILDKKMNENYQEDDEKQRQINDKIQLWRSLSLGYSEVNNEDFPNKAGSVCNGSMVNGSMCNGSIVNGSELCSDIGPSASIVAAEIAAKRYQPPPQKVQIKQPKEMEDGESSILEDLTAEEAYAKGLASSMEKGRKETAALAVVNGGHSRRNSDGGLFSCFGNAYGIEFRIVCGASNNNNKNNHGNSGRIPNTSNRSRKKWSSETNSA